MPSARGPTRFKKKMKSCAKRLVLNTPAFWEGLLLSCVKLGSGPGRLIKYRKALVSGEVNHQKAGVGDLGPVAVSENQK